MLWCEQGEGVSSVWIAMTGMKRIPRVPCIRQAGGPPSLELQEVAFRIRNESAPPFCGLCKGWERELRSGPEFDESCAAPPNPEQPLRSLKSELGPPNEERVGWGTLLFCS